MAITRTPTAPAPKPVAVDEKQIEALINKGGSSTLAKEPKATADEDPIKTVLIRTYESQIQEIDQLLAQLPKRQRLSRNAFIVEAIEERLRRGKTRRK